jgi:uncharacterized iron-regulated membrane protein
MGLAVGILIVSQAMAGLVSIHLVLVGSAVAQGLLCFSALSISVIASAGVVSFLRRQSDRRSTVSPPPPCTDPAFAQ